MDMLWTSVGAQFLPVGAQFLPVGAQSGRKKWAAFPEFACVSDIK